MRKSDGKSGNWTRTLDVVADDFAEANGADVLDFWAAQDRARITARAGKSGTEQGGPLTLQVALDRYRADLEARGADVGNVARAQAHLSDSLSRKLVGLLKRNDLSGWRDSLVTHMAPASANRCCTPLRAALNLAADGDETIANRSAWEVGLKAIPDQNSHRNVILLDAQVRKIVAEAPKESAEFGLLVEVAAVTGARPSQIARLELNDAKSNFLEMPSSRKGRGVKRVRRVQVPISNSLSKRLRVSAAKRPEGTPLLAKNENGDPWKKSDHSRPFERTAERAGLDPAVATIYALRHSSIVRALKKGVPIAIVAKLHDTSAKMIETNYSVKIDEHVDAIVRPALLNVRERAKRKERPRNESN